MSILNALIECSIDCLSLCNWPINVQCPQCLPQCMLYEIGFDLTKWTIEGLLSRNMYFLCQINVFEFLNHNGHGQVMASHSICGMQLLVPSLDTCFWHASLHMIMAILKLYMHVEVIGLETSPYWVIWLAYYYVSKNSVRYCLEPLLTHDSVCFHRSLHNETNRTSWVHFLTRLILWPTFCRWHLQMHFLEKRNVDILTEMSTNISGKGLINSETWFM